MTSLYTRCFEPVRSILTRLFFSKAATLSHHGVPLPKVLHETIYIPTDKKIFLIGDVHGCYDECLEVVQKCQAKGNGVFIFVGDLINKGPKSLEVVRLARSLQAHCVRGNHDDVALRNRLRRKHMTQAMKDADTSNIWVDSLTDDEVSWLMELPFTITLPNQNAIIVHAGLVPGVPLKNQDPNNMFSMRNVVSRVPLHDSLKDTKGIYHGVSWDGTSDGKQGLPWATQWPGPQHVYFGHDAVRMFQCCPHATGLDTGCLYGGRLTALVLPDNEVIQVHAKQVYVQPGSKR